MFTVPVFALAVIKFQCSNNGLLCQHNLYRTHTTRVLVKSLTGCDNTCSILPVYAGSGTNYFDLSLEPTQELFVTLVTLRRVCSVASVTLDKSLFCHFSDLLQEFILNLPVGELQGQLSAQTYRASYRSKSTGPVIGPRL